MPQPPYTENQKAAAIAHQPGLAKVTYPNDDLAYPVVTREITVDKADKELAFLTPDAEYPQCLLIAQPIVSQDHAMVKIVRVFERIPGPLLYSSRIDPDDGSVIQEVRQTVLASNLNVGSSAGAVTITYEPRADSDVVSIKKTTTTAYDGVVRSLPVTVDLDLPRVLAGLAVSFFSTGADGDDTSRGVAGGTGTRHVNASARSSGSLAVLPEAFPTIRDYTDSAKNVEATAKQVFLAGAVTPAAIRARLTAVYEVIVTGALTPDATGTYPGNSSNVNGVIWFFKESTSRNLKWAAGVWSLGTDAEVLAGNFWKRTAAATSWIGTYAPQGTTSGTATVAVGRTVLVWPRWGTVEVNLVTASPQVSVSANASASEEDGTATSLTLSSGKSVSVGGSQGRVRIEPTLHGAITIPNGTYTASVNATAIASISGLSSTGIDSGFPSGTNPNGNRQFATSYVRLNAAAMGTSSFTPATRSISGNTVANPTVVTTTTAHGLTTGQAAVITGSDSTPSINGTRAITRLSATTFSVAVNVTIAGTTGTVQGPTATVSAASFIAPTVPEDVPFTGLYQLPRPQTSGKDAIYTSVNTVVVDMAAFAATLGKPIAISYADPTPTYFQGIAITANQPAFQGGPPASYGVSPSLPTGLTLSTTTGIITGTPSVGQVATTYTVTATNGSGSATTTITITVQV